MTPAENALVQAHFCGGQRTAPPGYFFLVTFLVAAFFAFGSFVRGGSYGLEVTAHTGVYVRTPSGRVTLEERRGDGIYIEFQ